MFLHLYNNKQYEPNITIIMIMFLFQVIFFPSGQVMDETDSILSLRVFNI